MAQLRSYRELSAWQKAMDLAEECYAASAAFPSEERFGLTQQLRRCCVSIPSNIAEGHRFESRVVPSSHHHCIGFAGGAGDAIGARRKTALGPR